MKRVGTKGKKKGAALVVAVLLSAIIGSAAIGLTAIAFRQVNIAETYNNGLVAYYAAESGVEQGLLYYKFNKNREVPQTISSYHSADPAGLLRRPANVSRNFISQATTMQQPANTAGSTLGYTQTDRNQVYDLQMYYKQAYAGDDVNGDGTLNEADIAAYPATSKYKILKDNLSTFSIYSDPDRPEINKIVLYWKWTNDDPIFKVENCGGRSRGVEVKIKVKEVNPISKKNEFTAVFQDPRCTGTIYDISNALAPDTLANNVFRAGADLQTAMNMTAYTVTQLSIKPIGSSTASGGIYFGYNQGPAGGRNASGLSTTIQSIGYFAGNSRQITANIDRQTGTILDIFNYVIYKGQ